MAVKQERERKRRSEIPTWAESIDAKNKLPAAQEWAWNEDPAHHHSDLKITVTNAFYGKALLGPEEIYKEAIRIQRATGFQEEVPNVTATTGFDELYQVPGGLSDPEYIQAQKLAFSRLIPQALTSHGIKPSDVDLVLAAATMPIDPDFDKIWKEAGGIPANVPSERLAMACNSSGRAIANVLSGENNVLLRESPRFHTGEPLRIMIAACDDPQRFSNEGSDPISPQFFSTGAAVMIFEYHPNGKGSFKLLSLVNRSIEDGTQHLRARATYKNWTDEQRAGVKIAEHLQEPEPGKGSVDMNGRAGVMFKKYAVEVTKELMTQYGESPNTIARVIVHHPSKAVFDSLQSALVKYGFAQEKINWVINEGNVPVATIPIAFGRQLDEINPGDRLLVLSFGAGGEYTGMIVETGSAPLR